MDQRPEHMAPEPSGDEAPGDSGVPTPSAAVSLGGFTLSPNFSVSKADASAPNPDSSLFLDAGQALDPFSRPLAARSMHWSVGWADLMMTMFIFFVVMFIYQSAHREFALGKRTQNPGARSKIQTAMHEKLAGPMPLLDPKETSMASFYQVVRHAIQGENLGTVSSVNLIGNRAVRIILPGDLFFEPGKADLKPASFASLRKIADILKATPYMVDVVGHTDSTPVHSDKFPTNWELSAYRACVVVRFFIEEMKLSPERFFVSAYSYYQPVAPNDTWAHREANRRVEIMVLNKRSNSAMGSFPIFQNPK